ncbi:CGNR zinc finger domain-containing protein [Bradyrhizobium sp. GCM10027634]|uniref:CGNR zinc finger domain-containing protein n=1 Tax=unclassified Bradyrhizobium TaxID=2631580 RepID=UPI00263AFE29|nr:CGNR zinc finger domain-containing protein [Bradyrhizobium sp. WYCCWR 12677]MDN5005182.1 CGNR zinc finger domain-containing protein [Bradyrhizobium sp. WYCCWR 12677]
MSRESRKFHVPDALANLYDFANTLDLRHFIHHGVQHQQTDELQDPAALGEWMRQHGLIQRTAAPSQKTFEAALRLRAAIRDYLKCEPAERHRKPAVTTPLNAAMEPFALRVAAIGKDGFALRPVTSDAQAGLSAIVAELYDAASAGTLARLKMCAADECQRVFFDRSKPGTRRWCQSTLCGNREKTRTYRERHRDDPASGI